MRFWKFCLAAFSDCDAAAADMSLELGGFCI